MQRRGVCLCRKNKGKFKEVRLVVWEHDGLTHAIGTPLVGDDRFSDAITPGNAKILHVQLHNTCFWYIDGGEVLGRKHSSGLSRESQSSLFPSPFNLPVFSAEECSADLVISRGGITLEVGEKQLHILLKRLNCRPHSAELIRETMDPLRSSGNEFCDRKASILFPLSSTRFLADNV